MSRWSLRTRMATASAAAILVALALLGIAATLVVEHQLRSTVDRDLRWRAVDVAQLAAVTPGLLDARSALDLGSGGTPALGRGARPGGPHRRPHRLAARVAAAGQSGARAGAAGRACRLRRRPLGRRADPALRRPARRNRRRGRRRHGRGRVVDGRHRGHLRPPARGDRARGARRRTAGRRARDRAHGSRAAAVTARGGGSASDQRGARRGPAPARGRHAR